MKNLLHALKYLVRTALYRLVRLLGASGVRAAALRARQPVSKKPRILLIHPGHLGATVMTTPVLHALKDYAPDVHITMMVGPWSAEVVERHSDLDQLLTCPFPSDRDGTQKGLGQFFLLRRIAKQLRSGNYDVAINFRPRFLWGAALLYLAGIPRRIGYAVEPCTPFLTEALPYQSHEHFTVSYLRLTSAGLQTLGYPSLAEPYTAERYPLHFLPKAHEQQWVSERLSIEGIDGSAPVVVIHPGTGTAVKLWRAEAWAMCAATLSQSSTSSNPARIILTGSKSERPLLQEIAGKTSTCTTLVTDMTLGQLAALLQRAQLVLGVDSGPLHLAVAQGTPTVRIFGPTDSRTFGPWGSQEQHSVVSSTHRCPACPCIPCRRLDFRPEELPTHPCVRLVTEQEVLAAISRYLPHFPVSRGETRSDAPFRLESQTI